MLENMDDAPLDLSQVKKWTVRDVTLSQVHNYLLSGWPHTLKTPNSCHTTARRLELGAQDGCILWGARTVIQT